MKLGSGYPNNSFPPLPEERVCFKKLQVAAFYYVNKVYSVRFDWVFGKVSGEMSTTSEKQ